MLTLRDFFHLPQLAEATAQIVRDGPGLTVVTGLDPRGGAGRAAMGTLPASGRATVFRVLIGEFLAAAPHARGVIVAGNYEAVRIPNALRKRLKHAPGQQALSLGERIRRAAAQGPDLLVIERLDATTIAAAAEAASSGVRVIAQLDSVFRGASVARHLRELGMPPEQLDCLHWVVFVQRMATLCATCRRPAEPSAAQLALLPGEAPELALFQAPGCEACGGKGRKDDVAVFDIFRFPGGSAPAADPHILSLERYTRGLAAAGLLAIEDLIDLGDDQLWRTYQLLNASERALADANSTLQRKVAELEAANRVLQQRTEALISLQGVTQALFATTRLNELSRQIWRHARELCGADRALLFGLGADGMAEAWAEFGWGPDRAPARLPASEIFREEDLSGRPSVYNGWPPGIAPRHADVEGADLRAGLRVPLVSEGRPVGMLFVHSTRKARFTQAEIVLIQTFASQAALALQRAELFSELSDKIAQLESAQAALVERERLEREMELAHEVQQDMLPRHFPSMPRFHFAAQNRPARQVGGDLYDVFQLDDEHVGLVIGDVSGKGMPAALYMALTRSLLLAEARREASPRAVLLNVNNLLRELGEPHLFVTVFYGVLSTRTRQLTFARAGHDYPLLLREGGLSQLGGDGTVLGFFPSRELRLSEEQISLQVGDRLVLYTDGLTDIQNPAGQRIELEGLHTVLLRQARLAPQELIEATFADLTSFQGSAAQYDDMTMLVTAVAG